MKPITVEFRVTKGGETFTEDSVTLHNAEEFFNYVGPGGGCEQMPENLGEIQMIFASADHPNSANPIADKRVNLQLGMVLFSGSLSMITRISQDIIDKHGRGELSKAFMSVIGV